MEKKNQFRIRSSVTEHMGKFYQQEIYETNNGLSAAVYSFDSRKIQRTVLRVVVNSEHSKNTVNWDIAILEESQKKDVLALIQDIAKQSILRLVYWLANKRCRESTTYPKFDIKVWYPSFVGVDTESTYDDCLIRHVESKRLRDFVGTNVVDSNCNGNYEVVINCKEDGSYEVVLGIFGEHEIFIAERSFSSMKLASAKRCMEMMMFRDFARVYFYLSTSGQYSGFDIYPTD